MAPLELRKLRTPACSTSWRISPNAEGDEPDLEQQWLFPTRKFEAKFLNGKPLEIEYNFDPRRTRDNWVLVNVENLSPVLGGMVVTPAMNNFESIIKINNLLDIDVGYNNCSFGRHASCFCSTPEDPENMEVDGSECKYSHFHHFCGDHVGDWLLLYLFHSILLRESRELYNEIIAATWRRRHVAYLQEEEQATPEFWLDTALARGQIYSDESSDESP